MGERVSMGEQPYQVIAGLVAGTCLIWSLGEVLMCVCGGGHPHSALKDEDAPGKTLLLRSPIEGLPGEGGFPWLGTQLSWTPKASSHNLM